MKRLKLLGVALVALCAMGLMATSAFALPDISTVLAETSYPLHLNYESTTVATKLESTNGSSITGVGLKVLLLIGELTALGTFRADFTGVKEGTNKCSSEGDATEVALTEGSWHLVYTSLASESGGLRLGILYLPREVVLTCGTTRIKVKGSVIGSVSNILPTEGETTEYEGASGFLSGSAGKQQIKEYFNDQGTKVKSELKSTIGGTEKESDQVVTGEVFMSALAPAGKTLPNMFVVTSR